jgi:hypothetical protein
MNICFPSSDSVMLRPLYPPPPVVSGFNSVYNTRLSPPLAGRVRGYVACRPRSCQFSTFEPFHPPAVLGRPTRQRCLLPLVKKTHNKEQAHPFQFGAAGLPRGGRTSTPLLNATPSDATVSLSVPPLDFFLRRRLGSFSTTRDGLLNKLCAGSPHCYNRTH